MKSLYVWNHQFDENFYFQIYIAAFAVSSYASSCYRVGHKPFNPLLGETYENIREDRGWRFVAEQVNFLVFKNCIRVSVIE